MALRNVNYIGKMIIGGAPSRILLSSRGYREWKRIGWWCCRPVRFLLTETFSKDGILHLSFFGASTWGAFFWPFFCRRQRNGDAGKIDRL
jgi:hypothetical protein